MDENNIERWITVKGNHIPILKGESEEDALNRFFSNKEIKETADADDIDIDLELEDEDVKMPYKKLYYYEDSLGHKHLFDKSEIDKVLKWGEQVHEIEINDEMNQKMNELIEKYAETNNIREMVSQYENYLRYNTTGFSIGERKMLVYDFREQALEACEKYANEFLNKLPKLKDTSTTEANKANANGYVESHNAPYGSKEYDWYTSNCQRCIIAYEMRRRGYNVEANKYLGNKDSIYNTYLSLSRAFLDYNYDKCTKEYETQPNGEKYSSRGALIKAMERDMLKEGEGARFELNWDWKNARYGHTVNAEVINGEVIILDAQINKQYTIKDLINRKDLRATTLKCTRLDTLKLSNRLEDLVKWNH